MLPTNSLAPPSCLQLPSHLEGISARENFYMLFPFFLVCSCLVPYKNGTTWDSLSSALTFIWIHLNGKQFLKCHISFDILVNPHVPKFQIFSMFVAKRRPYVVQFTFDFIIPKELAPFQSRTMLFYTIYNKVFYTKSYFINYFKNHKINF